MVADLSASTYLVNGTDLQIPDVVELVHDGAGLWAGLTETIGTTTTPGRDGGSITGGVFTPFMWATMFAIHGDDFDAMWAQIVALRRRCRAGQTVTLTRIMPDPDGTDANVPHTTVARRVTDRPDWAGGIKDATVDIDWWVTEPWHGPIATVPGAGVHAVLGDTRTQRMTITLDPGPARSIANTSSDHLVQFFAVVPAGGVLIDVEACKATAITGGTDMSGALSWSKKLPMQLEAGSNTLLTDAGTFSIAYQPAYL